MTRAIRRHHQARYDKRVKAMAKDWHAPETWYRMRHNRAACNCGTCGHRRRQEGVTPAEMRAAHAFEAGMEDYDTEDRNLDVMDWENYCEASEVEQSLMLAALTRMVQHLGVIEEIVYDEFDEYTHWACGVRWSFLEQRIASLDDYQDAVHVHNKPLYNTLTKLADQAELAQRCALSSVLLKEVWPWPCRS